MTTMMMNGKTILGCFGYSANTTTGDHDVDTANKLSENELGEEMEYEHHHQELVGGGDGGYSALLLPILLLGRTFTNELVISSCGGAAAADHITMPSTSTEAGATAAEKKKKKKKAIVQAEASQARRAQVDNGGDDDAAVINNIDHQEPPQEQQEIIGPSSPVVVDNDSDSYYEDVITGTEEEESAAPEEASATSDVGDDESGVGGLDNSSGFSWIEFMKKTHLLSMYLMGVGKNTGSTTMTEQEDDMFASQMGIDLPGIHANNDLTNDERQYIERALLDSFLKVMNKLHYTVVSSYFVNSGNNNNSGIISTNYGIMSLVGGAISSSGSTTTGEEDGKEEEDAYYCVRQHDPKWNDFVEDILCRMTKSASCSASSSSSKSANNKKSSRNRRTDSFDVPDHVVVKLNKFHREACAVLGLDSPLKLHHRFWIISKKTNQSGNIMELWQAYFQKSLCGCEYDSLSEVAENSVIAIEHINVIQPQEHGPKNSPQQKKDGWRDGLMKDLITFDGN